MNYIYKDELYHHGIKGQRWGIRRFQNPDGSYTASGKERYRNKLAKKVLKKYEDTMRANESAEKNYKDLETNKRNSKLYKSTLEEYGVEDSSENFKEIYGDYKGEYEALKKQGEYYLEKYNKIMSVDMNTVSKKDIKRIYKEWEIPFKIFV